MRCAASVVCGAMLQCVATVCGGGPVCAAGSVLHVAVCGDHVPGVRWCCCVAGARDGKVSCWESASRGVVL